MHPVTIVLSMLTFRISASSTITVEVPVEFVNEDKCPGLKVGGVLIIVRHDVEIIAVRTRYRLP